MDLEFVVFYTEKAVAGATAFSVNTYRLGFSLSYQSDVAIEGDTLTIW